MLNTKKFTMLTKLLFYSVLCSCYVFDLPFMNAECWHNPIRSDLIRSTLPLVKDLENSDEAELGSSTPPNNGNSATPTSGQATPTSDQATPSSTVVDGAILAVGGGIEKMEVDNVEKNGVIAENGNGEKNNNKLIFKTSKFVCQSKDLEIPTYYLLHQLKLF